MQSIHMNRYPVIFASMVTKGCVESGKSVQHGGAQYSTAGMYVTGAANLADSIAAVEKCVFEDKDMTMDELIKALAKPTLKGKRDSVSFFSTSRRSSATTRSMLMASTEK